MKHLILIYFLIIISDFSVQGQSAELLIGSWKCYNEEPLDSTSEKYVLNIDLIFHTLDSITWNLNETEVIGWLTDTLGNYTGLKTHKRVEFGTGDFFKPSKDSSVIYLNLTQNSFHLQNQKIKNKYIIKNINNDSLIIQSTNNQEELKFKKQYIIKPKTR